MKFENLGVDGQGLPLGVTSLVLSSLPAIPFSMSEGGIPTWLSRGVFQDQDSRDRTWESRAGGGELCEQGGRLGEGQLGSRLSPCFLL